MSIGSNTSAEMNQEEQVEGSATLTLADVPASVRGWFGSENVYQSIATVNNQFGFVNEQVSIIPRLLLGLELHGVAPSEFTEKLSQALGVSPDKAEIVAREIKTKILEPARDALTDFDINIDQIQLDNAEREYSLRQGALQPTTVPQAVSQPASQPQTLVPHPEPPAETQAAEPGPITLPPSPQKPHILHRYEEVSQIPLADDQLGGLMRPTFSPPIRDGDNSRTAEPPPQARLEIGANNHIDTPPTTRVGREDARVIHYTAPDTPADPFGAQPGTAPRQPEREVPPHNIVDLKDLPR
jgi:hypothetical protein